MFMVLDINGVKPFPMLNMVTYAAFGILFGALGFSFLCLSVRCRACHGKVAWHFLKTADVNVWAWQLNSIASCPLCGDRP